MTTTMTARQATGVAELSRYGWAVEYTEQGEDGPVVVMSHPRKDYSRIVFDDGSHDRADWGRGPEPMCDMA